MAGQRDRKRPFSGARLVNWALAVLLAISVGFGMMPSTNANRPAQSATAAPRVQSAIDGVLDLFRQKSVVGIADFHGLAQEEAFYSALVRDPRFAKEVGNVVVEFGGSSAQSIIDRYENGGDVSLTELRHVWTDMVGWLPGPFSLGYVNFFVNVRAANRKLPVNDRIKIWLGDPKINQSAMRDSSPTRRAGRSQQSSDQLEAPR